MNSIGLFGGKKFVLDNGYLRIPDDTTTPFSFENPSPANTIFDELHKNLKVLFMSDIPPNGLTPPIKFTTFNSEIDENRNVNLIYSSAVPLKYGNANTEKSLLQDYVAGCVLIAQYFGAMVTAYYKSKQKLSSNGKLKLFLTPLGGGVFNNPRELIGSTILMAYMQAKSLLDDIDDTIEIIFIAWGGRQSEVDDFNMFFKRQQPVVAISQGDANQGGGAYTKSKLKKYRNHHTRKNKYKHINSHNSKYKNRHRCKY